MSLLANATLLIMGIQIWTCVNGSSLLGNWYVGVFRTFEPIHFDGQIFAVSIIQASCSSQFWVWHFLKNIILPEKGGKQRGEKKKQKPSLNFWLTLSNPKDYNKMMLLLSWCIRLLGFSLMDTTWTHGERRMDLRDFGILTQCRC